MVQTWLIELIKGIGKVFLNPVLYYSFFLAAILGVSRVKRERKNFHVRAYDAYFELRQLLTQGMAAGLILSIITIGAGIAVPLAVVILMAVFTLLWSLTLNIRMVSPAYTVGAAFFALIIIVQFNISIPVFSKTFQSLNEKVYPSVIVVLALLLLAEGFLILKNGRKATSPKLITSRRGQSVGAHEARRIWLLPLFLLIPGSALHLPGDWWPIFHIGSGHYSLILVPMIIGFHQQIQGMLPKEAVQLNGRRVILLGVLTVILSVLGYWYPIVSIIAAAVAVIGREAIALIQRIQDEGMPFYFSKKNNGLIIIGILPGSPADKMDLQVGELISKANGAAVRDDTAFYEALQKNRAHCKLEVLDTKGEVRFVQRALFEGDHHELGILFAQENRKFDEKIG
jgi:hypothetical protein